MLLSAMSVLVVAQSSSKIPEGLMNKPVYPHYLINGTIFGKRLLRTKCVSCFSLRLLSEAFLFVKKNSARVPVIPFGI